MNKVKCPHCEGKKYEPGYALELGCVRCDGKGEIPEQDYIREKAFDMVKDPNNWKNPIRAVVKADKKMQELIKDAIEFYCGSPCLITEKRDGEYVMVQAPGYYVCVGA